MKLKKLLIFPVVLSSFMLISCSSVSETEDSSSNTIASASDITTTTDAVKSNTTPAEITASIMDKIEIPSAVEKDISSLNIYYDVDESLISDMSLYICGSGAYPDELAVFQLSDSKNSDSVKASVQKRLDSQIALYKDYTPNEMYKLDNAVLKTKGNYVYFLVCSDNSAAEKIVSDMIK